MKAEKIYLQKEVCHFVGCSNIDLFLCTLGAVYGCLDIHLVFIKVVCFYIISLYNGLADQWGRGGGRRTRDR
jgi:hypothetical protein